MEKYKICPTCRGKNYPGLLECLFCEADLTAVRITDDETEREAEATDGCVPVHLVRLCDCGAKNPPNARKCAICGEDIGDILPSADNENAGIKKAENNEKPDRLRLFEGDVLKTPQDGTKNGDEAPPPAFKATPCEQENETKPDEAKNAESKSQAGRSEAVDATAGCAFEGQNGRSSREGDRTVLNSLLFEEKGPFFTLESIDCRYTFRLPVGETVVGRAASMAEYLAPKPFVSRLHCRFSLSDGILTLENLSTTNYTFCNNNRVVGRVTLKEGDEIALGGLVSEGKRQEKAAYFILKVTSCR